MCLKTAVTQSASTKYIFIFHMKLFGVRTNPGRSAHNPPSTHISSLQLMVLPYSYTNY